MRILKRISIVAAGILMLPACTAMLLGGGNSDGTQLGRGSPSATQAAADGTITRSVRMRLADDAVLGRYDLRIETVDSRVTLHGTVGSYEERERAVRLAGGIAGVERVDSRLRVDY